MSLILWHPVMLSVGIALLFGAYLMIQFPPRRLAEKYTRAIEGKPYLQAPTLWGKTHDGMTLKVHGMIYQLVAGLLVFGLLALICAWVSYATPTGR
jgi:hypothetical protein